MSPLLLLASAAQVGQLPQAGLNTPMLQRLMGIVGIAVMILIAAGATLLVLPSLLALITPKTERR